MDCPHIVEKVLPKENYIVRKFISNKTQLLIKIRLVKYEPSTSQKDVHTEGSVQPYDETIFPQNDLYVISRETQFGGLRILA